MQFDKTILNQTKLLRLYKAYSMIAGAETVKELIEKSKEGITHLMSCDDVIFFIVDEENLIIWRYDEYGEREENLASIGDIGLSIESQQIVLTSNPKESPNINFQVDINTTLPLLTVPVIQHFFSKKKGYLKIVRGVY